MPKVSFCGCAFCNSEKLTFHNGTVTCSNEHTFHTCDVHDEMVISGPRTTSNGICSCYTADTHMFVLQITSKPAQTRPMPELREQASLYDRWLVLRDHVKKLCDECSDRNTKRGMVLSLLKFMRQDPANATRWQQLFPSIPNIFEHLEQQKSITHDMWVDTMSALKAARKEEQELMDRINALAKTIFDKYKLVTKKV